MVSETKVILEGLIFPECPRWHDGRLWFSDMLDRKVIAVDPDGNAETIVEVSGQPRRVRVASRRKINSGLNDRSASLAAGYRPS